MKIYCACCEHELGDLEVVLEKPAIPHTNPEPHTVCWNGPTRTAHEFRQWENTGTLEFGVRNNQEAAVVYRFSDSYYINIVDNIPEEKTKYHVIVSNQEAYFDMRLEAEIYLWNEHARLERDQVFGRVRLK